jgi:glycosyltransferase involved in cell wall biosynthesis
VIALDLSRLLSRARSATPTGIDRVEMAYARYLVKTTASPACFAARNALGSIGLLPMCETRQFIDGLGALWRDGGTPRERKHVVALARRLNCAALFAEKKLYAALRESQRKPAYLLVSHQNLDHARPIARLKTATHARFVCFIHDLIPIEYPDLTRRGQARRHARRLETVRTLADAIITNSTATSDALIARLGPNRATIAVAPLGIDLPTTAGAAAQPYFVCVGTIELRKNHALLLEVWSHLRQELGDGTPRLLLIGALGYGSETITGRLTATEPWISRSDGLSDTEMAGLLCGARTLLLPSRAEGFGLPVVEAMAHGVPVICSDLPALRESGAGVPDYLPPNNVVAWHDAVVDHLGDTPRRAAQLERLSAWRPPSWAAHFNIVERLITDLG